MYKGPDKRGHIVADTLLPMMFLGLRKVGNICCGHKMFEQNQKHFLRSGPKFASATNVARAGKRGNICVGNNVSSFAGALTVVFDFDARTNCKTKRHSRCVIPCVCVSRLAVTKKNKRGTRVVI